MKIKLIVLSVASAMLLSACGSSNDSPGTMTGILSDSYVKGVTYTTSSNLTGTTGTNGEFSYNSGDTVTFKIGSVTLGSVDMANAALSNDSGRLMVRPKDLAGVVDETDEKSLAIGQFIQTAAGALPSDTHIDAGVHAGDFTATDTIDGLDKVATLANGAGLTPVSLEKVSRHMMNAPAHIKSVEFTPTDVTGLSDANRAISYTSSTVKVTYADGSTRTFPLSYVNLFNNIDTDKTADQSAVATVHDINGNIVTTGGAAAGPYVPQTPDANSLMSVGGVPYLVTHFEYENSNYGKLPMLMTLAKLDQNSSTGALSVNGNISQVDFSGVNGLWVPCAGSRSPWNTHLGSEEYEPDARCDVPNGDTAFAASSACTSMEYEARMNAFRSIYGDTNASPYNYGRVPEVTVSVGGTSSVEKWYTLGRIAREKVQFFGDSRTAIQGDDGTYTSLTMFVADAAKDLSAGTLYAAKWNQLSPTGTNGGKANLTWIRLGHGTNAEIKAAVDAGVKFSDLFDVDTTGGATPVAGFTRIKHGHEVATVEDLKLKSGTFANVDIATLAAFLETRRYAAIKGATVEFEKYEGVAYNARDNVAYAAMTRMKNGMADGASDPANDIRLAVNNSGAVYQLTLQSGIADTDGTAINSNHVPVLMEALVVGEDMTPDTDGNKSVIDKIASPDNLAFSEHMRVLFIGEDSSNHVNNYLWAYHVDTGKLVRILSIPMGAESTGLQVVDNMNGHAYIMSNYQHAGDRNSTAQATYDRILPLINPAKAEVGYLGGLPAMR